MVILERLDDVVDELAVRRGVPSEPVASVAVETLAVEDRRLVVSARFVLLLLRRGLLLVGVGGDGGGSSCDQVSEDFSVFR